MSVYKPADSKREEFRKYLEKSGVLDALTKTLVTLYEEPDKPHDPLEFVKKTLALDPTVLDMDSLKIEVENLKNQVEKYKNENTQLREKLQKYEPNFKIDK